jgi:hypothetical protein
VNGKPDILEVVGNYVQLRRTGKEHMGLCPFHNEKTPSFSVNEGKRVFHCFGCGESGNVIDFIRKLKRLSFSEALVELGMDTTRPWHPRRSDALLMEARKLAAWADDMTHKAEYLLREIGQRIRFASEIPDPQLVRSFEHEWTILEELAEDLQNKSDVLDLYRQSDVIENLFADGIIEPLPEFPSVTAEYWQLVSDLPKPKNEEFNSNG